MATELRQILVRMETDLLVVHQASMQLAELAGIKIPEQVSLAGMIVSYCDKAKWPCLVKYCHEKIGDTHYFTTIIENPLRIIRKEIPIPFSGHLLSAFDKQPNIPDYRANRLQDLEQFCFAISHELKTSLSKLQLAVTLLEREELPATVNNFVDIIHRSASSLEQTLTSLNKVIEFGHHSPEVVKRLSLQSLFDQVYLEFAEMLARVQATVTTDLASITGFYYVEIYLRTIFTNLFSNAIKYSEPSRPLQLSFIAHRQENTIVLTVIDNGQGIDLVQNGSRLFNPFTRFSEKEEGAGIGLYLVKTITERNGGSVEVESAKGRGSTFRFYLNEYPVPQDDNFKNTYNDGVLPLTSS